jgi:hypothetical protein
MAKGGKQQVQRTEIDPALQPYRDQYLRQAFGYAQQQPLRFFGAPGYAQGSQLGGSAQPGVPTEIQQMWANTAKMPSSIRDKVRSQIIAKYGQPGPNGQWGGGPGAGGVPEFQAPPTYGAGQDPWVAAPDQQYTDMFMNPYEDQVIGGIQGDFDRQRQVLSGRVNDLATKARAFGGSRHAVLEGEGLRDLGQTEANTLGKFRYAGYDNALTRGMGLRQAEFDAGRSRFDQAQNYGLNQLGIMRDALGGAPGGSVSYAPRNSSPLQGGLGGALAAGALTTNPWYIGGAGLLGLLGSL